MGLIDSIIKKKQRKIKLLKEKRTSLINESVTRGLDPNVKMKDSGVEWIGEIPEEWVISKLKYDSLKPVRYGLNISSKNYIDNGLRFIRITDITDWGELILNKGKFLNKELVDEDFRLEKYDVLFCRSGATVGKSYLHLYENNEYTSGGYLVRFNFGNYFYSKFIFYFSKSSCFKDWIKLNTVVSTIENVNGEKYSNLQYPLPNNDQIEDIVKFLDSNISEIFQLIDFEKKKIIKLKEYRQSLISEVVTGKIRVCEEDLSIKQPIHQE